MIKSKIYLIFVFFSFLLLMGCRNPAGGTYPPIGDNHDPYPLVSPTSISITSGNMTQTVQLLCSTNIDNSNLYDEDGDIVTVVVDSATSLPGCISLNETTGLLTITRNEDYSGNIRFWTVDDNGGSSESDLLTVSISVSIPANDMLFFASDRDGDMEIYSLDIDNTTLIQLTTNTATEKHPSVSVDGTKIVFVSNSSGSWAIYTMDSDGNNVSGALVTLTGSVDGYPSFNSDKSKIVFEDGFDIFTMNSNGSSKTNITNSLFVNEKNPSWSPTANVLSYSSSSGSDYEIHTMNSDGTGSVQLTTNSVDDQEPCWSSDGSMITFSTNRDSNYEIYTMNSDGSTQTNLTNTVGIDETLPAWSSNGISIAYEKSGEIYKRNSDGSGNETNLTNDASDDQDPSW